MNKDIRVSCTFFRNLKTLKLQRRLGSDGVVALEKIWIYAGTERPNGILEPLESVELEMIAEWSGKAGMLTEVLVETGFLEKTNRGFAVHDWKDHNAYAFHAPYRAEQASKAAAVRWRGIAPSMPGASLEHNNSNAPSPSPSPVPSPTPNTLLSESEIPTPCPHLKIISLYNDILCPPLRPVKLKLWKGTRASNLQARWKEDGERQDVEWWNGLFQYIKKACPFLMGKQGAWSADLGWIIKSENMVKILEGKYEKAEATRGNGGSKARVEPGSGDTEQSGRGPGGVDHPGPDQEGAKGRVETAS